MEAIYSSETSIKFQRTTQRYIVEDRLFLSSVSSEKRERSILDVFEGRRSRKEPIRFAIVRRQIRGLIIAYSRRTLHRGRITIGLLSELT
jgi:hypothetical protein